MADFLLTEDGDEIELEDGTGFILLEDSSPDLPVGCVVPLPVAV
jgi:hypothetical protein